MEAHEVKIIKQAIRQTIDEGKKITANWDAGHDQTICNVYVDEVYNDFGIKDIDVGNALRYAIIDTLSLPNASEDQHVGKGNITIDAANKVTLTYDNTYCSPYSANPKAEEIKEEPALEVMIPYEDRFGFTKFIPRISVTFYAYSYLDPDTMQHPSIVDVGINIRVLEGDVVKFDDQAFTHLKNWVKKYTSSYFEELTGMPEDISPYAAGDKQMLTGIDLSGELTTDSQLQCYIDKSYEYTTYTKNKTVVLIP